MADSIGNVFNDGMGVVGGDDELVADARHDVAGVDQGGDAVGDGYQQIVAGVVPESVVDLLEAIEVNEYQSQTEGVIASGIVEPHCHTAPIFRLGYAVDAIGAKRVVLDSIEVLFAALDNVASAKLVSADVRARARPAPEGSVPRPISCQS